MIGLPKTLPPKSSTAICAAATDPGPVAVAAGPDKSVSTPIFTTSSETCALATPLSDKAQQQQRWRTKRASELLRRIVILP